MGQPFRLKKQSKSSPKRESKASPTPFSVVRFARLRLSGPYSRRQAEKERCERVWFQTVIDQLPDPVFLVEMNGRVIMSERARELCTKAIEEKKFNFFKKRIIDIRTSKGEEIKDDDRPIVRVLKNNESIRDAEYSVVKKDGKAVPVLVTVAPLLNSEGKKIAALAVFKDISVSKKLEQLRDEWAAVVTHDLKQPLVAIQLANDVLRKAMQDRVLKETQVLQRISFSANLISEMLNDLTNVSLLESRNLTLNKDSFSIRDIICELVDHQFADLCQENRIRVSVPDRLPSVEVDKSRIQQVLTNLITNAIKYGDPQSEIAITAEQGKDALQVSVINSGRMIPTEDREKIFLRFYRSKLSIKSVKRGLGLGLYISKGLIEAHGGKIWVESADGKTTFYFTLPLA